MVKIYSIYYFQDTVLSNNVRDTITDARTNSKILYFRPHYVGRA